MDSSSKHNPLQIHVITSTESPEFFLLTQSLTRSSVIGLDAEWKPLRAHQPTFPTVTLLQLACQLGSSTSSSHESRVFLIDLCSLPLSSIWELLRHVFVSPDILKLGFRFKQDLVYLSYTFSSNGCHPGFDKVEPYLDITSVYHYTQHKQSGKKMPKETKSLATICREVLGIHLSKELQCSDWSLRPLSEEQKTYAATDAHCLLKIFDVFFETFIKEGCNRATKLHPLNVSLGLKEVLETKDVGIKPFRAKVSEALDIVQATISSQYSQRTAEMCSINFKLPVIVTKPMDSVLLKIVRKYGEKILLRESDRKPKSSKKKEKEKEKRQPSLIADTGKKHFEDTDEWQGPPPWEKSIGGDGCPKFLCDVMVEGLAKHLRCVGIDAAVPFSKKPDSRELIDQAYREERVLLTRDAKLLRHQYLVKNQIYRVKSLLKNEQLLEVISTFHLKISEDQLMSRCTKCNGKFIQKPLTTEEAIEAAKGFQKIPSCLFNKNLEFWQCMDCNQLYWEHEN